MYHLSMKKDDKTSWTMGQEKETRGNINDYRRGPQCRLLEGCPINPFCYHNHHLPVTTGRWFTDSTIMGATSRWCENVNVDDDYHIVIVVLVHFGKSIVDTQHDKMEDDCQSRMSLSPPVIQYHKQQNNRRPRGSQPEGSIGTNTTCQDDHRQPKQQRIDQDYYW